MYTTTDYFQQEMNKNLRKAPNPEIVYVQIDSLASVNSSVTNQSSAQCYFSQPQQIFNNKRLVNDDGKIGTLEQNLFLLDGNYKYSPNNDEIDDFVGWRSEQLADSGGLVNVTLNIESTKPINCACLSIQFSKMYNEYAVDFEVYADGQLLEQVENNSNIYWSSNSSLVDVSNISIHITQWSRAYRRVKISQLDFGQIISLTENEITSYEVVQKFSPISSQLSEDSFSFKFVNDGTYSPIQESQSQIIKQGQALDFFLGYDNDKVKIGSYIIAESPTVELQEVKIECSNYISLLDKPFSNSYPNTTLFQIARDILSSCGISNYVIDESLLDIEVEKVYLDGNAREILTSLLIAGMVQCWEYDGIVYIGTKSTIPVDEVISQDKADKQTITRNGKLNNITIEYVTVTQDAQEKALATITAQQQGETEIKTVEYNTKPAMYHRYAWNGRVISYTLTDVTVEVWNSMIVYGYPLQYGSASYSKQYGNYDDGFDIQISSNPFIVSEEHAIQVMDWIANYYNNCNEIQNGWRQNPALQVGDIVGVQTDYGNYQMQIEENTLSSTDGGLYGESKGRLLL